MPAGPVGLRGSLQSRTLPGEKGRCKVGLEGERRRAVERGYLYISNIYTTSSAGENMYRSRGRFSAAARWAL